MATLSAAIWGANTGPTYNYELMKYRLHLAKAIIIQCTKLSAYLTYHFRYAAVSLLTLLIPLKQQATNHSFAIMTRIFTALLPVLCCAGCQTSTSRKTPSHAFPPPCLLASTSSGPRLASTTLNLSSLVLAPGQALSLMASTSCALRI